MIHVGTFISLSSELAVAAAPHRYRLSKGLLNQRVTIKELQVREHDRTSLCARDPPALAQIVVPPSCNDAIRATPLPSTGWAACRLLFTRWP